jgi:hypothetical protein
MIQKAQNSASKTQTSYLHIFSLIFKIRREFKKCRNKLTDKQLKQLHNAVESVENIIEDEIDLRTDERVREFFRVKRADEGVKQ